MSDYYECLYWSDAKRAEYDARIARSTAVYEEKEMMKTCLFAYYKQHPDKFPDISEWYNG